MVNKKRHMIMCEVYDTGGISCNTILWKRGDTGENYSPGSYNNINVTCKEVTNSTIETTLGIQQVTAEYFKTSFSVIYNGPLSRTIEYHLSIPEEYSNPAAAVQPFLALIYSIILAAILLKIHCSSGSCETFPTFVKIQLVRSEYTVKVWSPSTWVNPGDSYVAYCNIPDVGALDIVRNLEVMWFHNSQQLTNLCVFLSSELTMKYFCNVRSPQINNISLAITLTNVQKTDEGNLSCVVYEKNETKVRGDLVAMKSVPIQVREPIKSMRFKFDQSIEFSLTEENTEALHPLQVLPGRYAPTCQVNGSKPTANVRIMMDSDLMNGRKFDLDDKMVTEFVAEETDFRKVDGLPNSEMQRTYQVLVRQETTLEILQVTAEYFKTSFSVIYNDPLFQTREFQLSIPQEYTNSVVALQTSFAWLYRITHFGDSIELVFNLQFQSKRMGLTQMEKCWRKEMNFKHIFCTALF
uniref:Uncharacterized protein n=1 Tax=Magallana gigas TaxID=29159 RepID=K1Q676_MAGGI